jgi:hypothetical protein
LAASCCTKVDVALISLTTPPLMLERLLRNVGLRPCLPGFGKVGAGEFTADTFTESVGKDRALCWFCASEALAPVHAATNRHITNNLRLVIILITPIATITSVEKLCAARHRILARCVPPKMPSRMTDNAVNFLRKSLAAPIAFDVPWEPCGSHQQSLRPPKTS